MARNIDELPVYDLMAGEAPFGSAFGPQVAELFATGLTGPIRNTLDDSLLIFRNADLHALSAAPEVGMKSADELAAMLTVNSEDDLSNFIRMARNHLFTMNPPSHTPIRAAFFRQFLPKHSLRFKELARASIERALESVIGFGKIDFSADVAYPAAAHFWGEMLGLTLSEQAWIVSNIKRFSIAFAFERSPEQTLELEQLIADYFSLVTGAVDRRFANGNAPDYLRDMAAEFATFDVPGKPEKLSEMLAAICLDGFHTMCLGVVGVVRELIVNEGVIDAIKADPALASNAVAEGLRLNSPTVFTQKAALVDFEYGDVAIPAGTNLTMFWTAGSRDPKVFEHPDTFDLHRRVMHQISFGGGVHLCAGRNVAKMYLDELVSAVVAPGIVIKAAGDANRWVPMSSQYELEELPVTIDRA